MAVFRTADGPSVLSDSLGELRDAPPPRLPPVSKLVTELLYLGVMSAGRPSLSGHPLADLGWGLFAHNLPVGGRSNQRPQGASSRGVTTMKTTTQPTRRWLATTAAAAAVCLGILGSAAPASASDWGGYADPNSAQCGTNTVVKRVPITGRAGLVGAYLEIKWSNGCPGNYARVVMANQHSGDVAVSIQAQASPYNKAGADETRVTTAWTRVIALANSSDRVCAYTDIKFFYQMPWEARKSASVCA